MSKLSGCIAKAGALLPETDAIIMKSRAQELAARGMAVDAAEKQAVEERIREVDAEIAQARQGAPEPRLLFSRAAYAPGLEDAGQTAEALVARQSSWVDSIKRNLFGMGFRTQFVDRLAPLEAIATQKMEAVKGMQMMYYLRMYDQRMHFTSLAVGDGVPQVVEKARKDGKKEFLVESQGGPNLRSVVDILANPKVAQAAGNADKANRLFTLYLLKQRADRVGYGKLNFKVTESEIKNAVAQIESNPVLREAFSLARSGYNLYNRALLRFAVQTGALGQAQADTLLAADDYIPYYRMRNGVAELMIGSETPIRVGDLKDSPHLAPLIGGDEPIFDFLTSSVQNTSMMLDMSLRNIAIKNAMYGLRDAGLAKIGLGSAPKGAVEFREKGALKYAIVDDATQALGFPPELLVKGLEGIPTMFPYFVRLMGVPARVLRRAVVASPVYMARQLFRDSLASTMVAGANTTPIVSALRQMRKPGALDKRGVVGGQVFTGTSEDVSRELARLQAGGAGFGSALAKLEAASLEVDAATRRSQYESYIKQGLSEMEATFMALESMNFGKRGVSPTMHFMSTMIPFLNAQIQGLDVLYKALAGKMPMEERLDVRRKLFTRGAMMLVSTLLYASLMQDDEAYKNAPPEQKYGNWFVRVPGFDEPVRVPVPFEIGYMFKSLPEILLNTAADANTTAGDGAKALGQILKQMVPGASSYGIPQAVKPLIEMTLGKSFFTGRDIETAAEQQLEPWARSRATTSEIAKGVGGVLNMSPVMLEYAVRSYLGALGLLPLQVADLALKPALGSADGPERRTSEMPLVGTLFQPNDATYVIDYVYKEFEKINQINATFKRMVEEGKAAEAERYLNANIEALSLASLAGSYKQEMGELASQARKIKSMEGLSAQEKRELLDQIRKAQIEIAGFARRTLSERTRQDGPA